MPDRQAPASRLTNIPRDQAPAERSRRPSRPLSVAMAAAVVALALGSAVVGTAAAGELFSDGFESGGFGAWSGPLTLSGDGNASIQSSVVKSGTYAVRLSESGNPLSGSFLRQAVSPARAEVRAAGDFQIISEGVAASSVPLIRLFSATGTRIFSLYRPNGSNRIYVQHSGAYIPTSGSLTLGTWARFEIHVVVNGSASAVDVLQNGISIYSTTSANLGASAIAWFQLGNEIKSQAFALAADNIVITDGSAVGGPGPTPTPTPTPTATATASAGGGDIRHVIWVLFENQEASAINATSAPYFTSFASTYANFTNMYALTHPSLPNYIAMWSGSTQGITDDGTYNLNVPNLSSQLTAAGKDWASFAQNYPGSPSNCAKGSSYAGTSADGPGLVGTYVRRHNPPMDFTSVSGSASECAKIQPLRNFDPTVDFALVVPNLYNDMHDAAPGSTGGNAAAIRQGDDFLRAFVPMVTSSPDWAHTLLIVTFDEGTTSAGPGGGHIYTAAAAPWLSHETISTTYDLYDILRTTEHIFGLGYLGNAGSATTISELLPSGTSPTPTPTATSTPTPTPTGTSGQSILSDGFENGLGQWSVQTAGDGSVVAQSSIVKSGSQAARLAESSASASQAYARASLGASRSAVTVSADFRQLAEGPAGGNVPLLRLYDSNGTRLVSFYRQNQSSDRLYISYGSTLNKLTTGTLPLNTWAQLSVHIVINGASSTVEVMKNGASIYRTTQANLSGDLRTVQIGNDTKHQPFDLVVDNVVATNG